jgi:hypothetical protein
MSSVKHRDFSNEPSNNAHFKLLGNKNKPNPEPAGREK